MSVFRAFRRPITTLVAAALASVMVSAPALAGPRTNVGRGIVRDGDTVVVEEAAGKVEIAVEAGWEVVSDDEAGLVILVRSDERGRTVRVLDRRGRMRGEVTAPAGWQPVVTSGGVVLVPVALHGPLRRHQLRFLAYDGAVRREVDVPELSLLQVQRAVDGRVITISSAGGGDDWEVIVYDAQGRPDWRQKARSGNPPDAVLSSNGRRLVLVEHGADDDATVSVFSRDGRLKKHDLVSVARLVPDPGSSKVAAIGRDSVALLDADTGKLAWRRQEPLDLVVQGGVRFDRRSMKLLVVTADRDRAKKKARVAVRGYRVSDGQTDRADVVETPLGETPAVVDLEALPGGERRVVLPDRAITTAPGTPE